MRLQKFLARSGVASRRASEKLILAGKVSVNGQIITELGVTVKTSDVVRIRGEIVRPVGHVYYLLNKPTGYVTTAKDDRGRPIVTDLVPCDVRVYPVGRLDLDTSGLLLMTNDGQLAYALTHPKFEVARVYCAEVDGCPDSDDINLLLAGVLLEDGPAAFDSVSVLRRGSISRLRVQIHIGKNRIVRRMLETVGHPVLALKREAMGVLRLGDLAPGEHRRLVDGEIKRLYKSVGLDC